MKLDKDGFVFTKEELKAFEIQNPTIYSIIDLAVKQGVLDKFRTSKRDVCNACFPIAIFNRYCKDAKYCVCDGMFCDYGILNKKLINTGFSCVALRWNDIINGNKDDTWHGNEEIDNTPITLKHSIRPV